IGAVTEERDRLASVLRLDGGCAQHLWRRDARDSRLVGGRRTGAPRPCAAQRDEESKGADFPRDSEKWSTFHWYHALSPGRRSKPHTTVVRAGCTVLDRSKTTLVTAI